MSLSPLARLQELKYKAKVTFILGHLKTATMDNIIREISLSTSLKLGEEVGLLDHLLTSGKFRCLKKVRVSREDYVDLFPKLKAQGVVMM